MRGREGGEVKRKGGRRGSEEGREERLRGREGGEVERKGGRRG